MLDRTSERLVNYTDLSTPDLLEAYEELTPEAQLAIEPGIVKNETSIAIQKYIDDKAKEYRYDNMASVRSYTGFDNIFKEECLKLAAWGTSCWAVAGQIEYDVINGVRPMPTLEEVMAELPVYT